MADGRKKNLLDLIESISVSENCEQTIRIISQFIEKYYEINGVSIIAAPFNRSKRRIFSSNDPALGRSWSELVDESPQERMTREVMNPPYFTLIPWGKEAPAHPAWDCWHRDEDKRWLDFWDLIESCGFRANLLVPFWNVSPDSRAIVSFFSGMTACEQSRLVQEHGGDLLGIAAALSIRAAVQIDEERKKAVPILTNREVECLKWLAAGLRIDLIAFKLGISEWTVSFHLKNARDKLGAFTNEQALVTALMHGLLQP